ncbi:hypothetical protein HK098_002528, partial [Nowakowskiella sp. JEL0407]
MNTDKLSSRDSIADALNIPGLQLGPSALESRRGSSPSEIPPSMRVGGNDYASIQKRSNTVDSVSSTKSNWPSNWDRYDEQVSARDSKYSSNSHYLDSYSRDLMRSDIPSESSMSHTASYRSAMDKDIYKREQAYHNNSYYNPRPSQHSTDYGTLPHSPGITTSPTLSNSSNFNGYSSFPTTTGITTSPKLQRIRTNESKASDAILVSQISSRANSMQYKTVADLSSPQSSPMLKPSPHPILSSLPPEPNAAHNGPHVPPPNELIEPIIVDDVVNLFTITAHFGVITRFNALRYQSIKAEALIGGGPQPAPTHPPPPELNESIDTSSELFLDWLYLCRAEIRYEMWINYLAMEQPNPMSMPLPPLDVALFWHAHLLNPLR